MANLFDQFDKEETEGNPFDVFDKPPAAQGPSMAQQAGRTMQNIGKGYPVAEAAANIGSSLYGIPAAGIAGLGRLLMGADAGSLIEQGEYNPENIDKTLSAASDVIGKVQKALVFEPQTKAGKELLETATYPIAKLEEAGGYVGGELEKAGYPNLGAAAHTAVQAGPLLFTLGKSGGKITLRPKKAIDREVTRIIDEGIDKSIRPSVAGKRTFGQSEKYRANAREAVTSIVESKDALRLTNDVGEVVAGELPKNLKQFSQAIEQTKRNVFNEYDALTKQAGQAGAKVDLSSIVKELEQIAKTPTVEDLNPRVGEYAGKLAESLKKRKEYTAAEAQDAIATLNAKLDSFYKNPTYENANAASVDAMIANNLRQSLDTVIDNLTGEQYQPLKKKYGSLKAIERDVSRRAIVDARKNTKGLIDFSDMLSGADVAYGIMTMNPAMVGRGVAIGTIKSIIKRAVDPNRRVKNLFKDVEKMTSKPPIIRQLIKGGGKLGIMGLTASEEGL